MGGSDNASDIIADYLRLSRSCVASAKQDAAHVSTALPARDVARPCVLLLSPHPDDECLTGALPLRLLREEKWQVVNLAVTLGSDAARREGRKQELARACAVLGFHSVLPDVDGFSAVTVKTREQNVQAWRVMAARVAEIIAQLQPQLIVMPHILDAHPAHSGTHWVGMDALALQPDGFSCAIAQSEYWQPQADANLMIGVGEADASALLAALACHAGENARNPFDVRFPAYLIDNVRRGSELVGGAGAEAAQMDFAMLYKFGLWRGGKFTPSALKRIVGAADSLGTLIEP